MSYKLTLANIIHPCVCPHCTKILCNLYTRSSQFSLISRTCQLVKSFFSAVSSHNFFPFMKKNKFFQYKINLYVKLKPCTLFSFCCFPFGPLSHVSISHILSCVFLLYFFLCVFVAQSQKGDLIATVLAGMVIPAHSFPHRN